MRARIPDLALSFGGNVQAAPHVDQGTSSLLAGRLVGLLTSLLYGCSLVMIDDTHVSQSYWVEYLNREKFAEFTT